MELKFTPQYILRYIAAEMGNQSKLLTVPTTCIEYVHPWTDSCINANAGVVYVATLDSFKIYTAVYVVIVITNQVQI